MAILKTEGVIIRMLDFRESSKIVTCYTRDYGKIALIAKGAKRAKSRMGGSIDLLNHVAIIFYQKDTRELQTLSSIEILHSFPVFQQDLQRFSYALAAAEFLDRMEEKQHANVRVYAQLLEALHGFEKAENPELILLQFIWRWLDNAGFKPKLRRCLRCGHLPGKEPVFFSVQKGGYLCAKCYAGEENMQRISPRVVAFLLYLRDHRVDQVAQLKVNEQLLRVAREITWRFLGYHTDQSRDLKSLSFLKRIQGEEVKNGSQFYVTEQE